MEWRDDFGGIWSSLLLFKFGTDYRAMFFFFLKTFLYYFFAKLCIPTIAEHQNLEKNSTAILFAAKHNSIRRALAESIGCSSWHPRFVRGCSWTSAPRRRIQLHDVVLVPQVIVKNLCPLATCCKKTAWCRWIPFKWSKWVQLWSCTSVYFPVVSLSSRSGKVASFHRSIDAPQLAQLAKRMLATPRILARSIEVGLRLERSRKGNRILRSVRFPPKMILTDY